LDLTPLAVELTQDPQGLGYAAFVASGADNKLTALLNATDGKTPSRAAAVFGSAVVDSQVSDALLPSRVDAAVASYLKGQWPAIAVTIPADVALAAGLTGAHYLAAKISSEGAEPTKTVEARDGTITEVAANTPKEVTAALVVLAGQK
jgi:hypothetical protein